MRITYLKKILLITLLVSPNAQADPNKIIVGATESVLVGEKHLFFKARIDTGAQTSSIQAENIRIDTSTNPQGKLISFQIKNKQGDSSKIKTYVDSVITIKTSEGSETRFKVPLKIKWKNSIKTILFTLNDRSDMTYGLLLGRNWLRNDFIVDVDKNNHD